MAGISQTSQIDSSTNQPTSQKSTGGAAHVSDQAIHAVRNGNSATNAYDGNVPLARTTIINKQTAATIGGSAGVNDVRLVGIEVVKALTGTCVVAGFSDDAGAAASITLPAATPVGEYLKNLGLNTAGTLTVTCSNASDALNVIVKYWPA